jgi:hypothetical protein
MTYMRSWKSLRLTSHTWLGLNPQIGRPLSRIVVPLVYFLFRASDNKRIESNLKCKLPFTSKNLGKAAIFTKNGSTYPLTPSGFFYFLYILTGIQTTLSEIYHIQSINGEWLAFEFTTFQWREEQSVNNMKICRSRDKKR